MKKVYRTVFSALSAGLLISALSTQSHAQESKDSTRTDSENSLLLIIDDLGVEDLLNMKVSVASKKEERISDAPGMITSYSSNDIERYGYYTLKDLANITSGYSTFSAFGETNVETRGQKAGSWNVSKHLLLVDGIPMNHARANSAPMEYNIPLFFADKVEFLKGPGSALYGTSAFYGVMSITPKSLKEKGVLAEGKITYGDIGNSKRIMANAISKTDIGQTSVSFSYFKKGFSGDSIGIPKNTKLFDNDNSIFVNSNFKFNDSHKLKGLGVGVIFTRRNSHAAEFWGATPSPVNEVTWEEFVPYLKFKRDISKKLNFNSYLKYNASTEQSTFGASWSKFQKNDVPYDAYNYTTANIEALSEITYSINKTSSIIAGVNYDTRKELNSSTSFGYNVTAPDTSSKGYTYNLVNYPGSLRVSVLSAYSQYQNRFNVLKGLILTAGFRFDYGFNEVGKYSQLSPRIGLVQKITDNFTAKALYGTALRVPGIKELALNQETIGKVNTNGGNASGIGTISPEIIRSLEGGLNYNTNKFSVGIALFRNETLNALDGTQYAYKDNKGVEQKPNYFKNTNGKIVSKGIEFDGQVVLNQSVRFMLNHSLANAVINDTTQFTDVPTQKSNVSTTLVLPGDFKLATTAVFRMVHGYKTNKAIYGAETIDGYSMLDMNFLIPIIKNMTIEFQVRNVFDTKWHQPSLLSSPTALGRPNMLPIGGRSFMFTLAIKM